MHHLWIQRCFELASQGAGHVSPNPLVGSIIVGLDGDVLGEGFHVRYGGPHAEVEAIRDAEKRGNGKELRNATVYVNLEPCSHHGKTPPCVDLLLEKHLPRVVVAMEDPDPRVAGRGLARLREAGVEVTVGVLEEEAKRLNEAFLRHITTGRPLVTLKIAQSLDGKVAAPNGSPITITSLESRRFVHCWRSELDAVMIGSGTAMADDPQLSVRHVEGRQPVRVVLDRKGKLPPSLRLFSDEHASKTVAVVGERAMPSYEEELTSSGGRVIRTSEREGHLVLADVLQFLGRGVELERSIQSVLVEAGPGLGSALLRQDLVDRLFVFTAPWILGNGTPAFEALILEDSLSFSDVRWENVGRDMLFRGYRRAV